MRISFVTLLLLLFLPLTSLAQEEEEKKKKQTWIEFIDTHVSTTRKGFRHRTTIARGLGLPAFRLEISAPLYRVKGPVDPTGFNERGGGPLMPGVTIVLKF